MGGAYFKRGTLIPAFATTATAGGTTSLVNNSSVNQVFTGSMSQTVKLPDATTCDGGSNHRGGQPFLFINISTGDITIQDHTGASLTVITPGNAYGVILIDDTTVAGVWAPISFGGTASATNIVQEAAEYLGTPGQYQTSQAPFSAAYLWVSVNGVLADASTWDLLGDAVTFTSNIPDPNSDDVEFSYFGGTASPNVTQEIATYLGTPGYYQTSEIPVTAASLIIYVNGILSENSNWTLDPLGRDVTFTSNIPDPNTDTVTFGYLRLGSVSLYGNQGSAGISAAGQTVFRFTGVPLTAQAVWVYANGVKQDIASWDFVQGTSASEIIFHSGRALGESIYVIFFTYTISQEVVIIGGGGGGGGTITGADNIGAGVGVFSDVSSGVLEFNTLVAGAGITVAPSGDTIVISATGGGGGGGWITRNLSNAPLTVTATGMAATTNVRDRLYVVSAGGAVNVTANPQIAAGTTEGQEMLIIGTSDTNYPVFSDGNGLLLNGTRNMTSRQQLYLTWDSVLNIWRESFATI